MRRRIGARYHNHQCQFTLWAPLRKEVKLKLLTPIPQLIPMVRDKWGYFEVTVEGVAPDTLYLYQLDGEVDRPDFASLFQPQGVDGPSQIINHSSFNWQDQTWQGRDFSDWIIYEIHTGTFTSEGTFRAIIDRLPTLKALGINTLELMPIAQFSGTRNWGYDGVYPFAVQNSYGGCEGLKQLVNACHQQGFSIILDLVYNHFGPEGCYALDFAPYFTDKYQTPWGKAINYDDAYSDGVRNFVLENAIYWLREYHLDGFRLDAINTIYDQSPNHILQDLAQVVTQVGEEVGRPLYLIAESDLNDVRVIKSLKEGGYGMTAQWSDDFHHSLHSFLTGEQGEYYQDFGSFEQLVKALEEGFVYTGEYSEFRKKRHGNYAGDRPPQQLVIYAQNHDQVGNRALGDRLSSLLPLPQFKLATATLLLSPYTPLLFMGEEYGETNPFYYFIDHQDVDLIKAVRRGRKREFFDFYSLEQNYPDPDSLAAFNLSILDWSKLNTPLHQEIWSFYQQLIQIRTSLTSLRPQLTHHQQLLCLNWDSLLVLLNFNSSGGYWTIAQAEWKRLLESENPQLPLTLCSETSLTLNPYSLVIYQREQKKLDK